MKLAPSLHKTVLAGVGRVPLAPESVAGSALHDLLAGLPQETLLWHSIAAADLWQRAGFEPQQADPADLHPCAEERCAPRAAEQVLQLILRGIHPELLENWLAQARAANAVLPHACLVPLVERAMQQNALRSSVAPVLGQRGRWLVAQHEQWADSFGIDLGATTMAQGWELGSLAQRTATLRQLRSSDPAAALALLETDWAQEPAENRIALLPCLALGISLADEAFLERALDDKRKEVRTTAQQLLAELPGSQLVERCKARLLACFAFESKMFGPALVVTLPAECDKAMKRDGIGSGSHAGLGEKARWLLELMRCVSPLYWSERWQLAPSKVIKLFGAQEFSVALMMGLAQAACRAVAGPDGAGTVAWFAALAEYEPPRAELNLTETLLPAFEHLPLDEQERLAARWLDRPDRGLQSFSYVLRWAEQRASRGSHALAPGLSERLLRHLQRHMLATPSLDYTVRSHFQVLGRVLAETSPAYAAAHWPREDWEHWPQWRALVDELLETLHFRHTMQASFLENHA